MYPQTSAEEWRQMNNEKIARKQCKAYYETLRRCVNSATPIGATSICPINVNPPLVNFVLDEPVKMTSMASMPCCPKETETTMSYDYISLAQTTAAPATTDQRQRDYILQRLQDIKYEKRSSLRKTFGLTNDNPPESFDDLLARLTSGKFVISDDDRKKEHGLYSVMEYVTWRDPAVKQDQDGYDAAALELNTAFTTARDTAVLTDPTKAQVDAFAAWMPSNAPTTTTVQ